MNKMVRNLVFGMKELPEKGGYWGLLLKHGPDKSDLEPVAAKAIQEINAEYLEFAPFLQASNRGFGFVAGLIFGAPFITSIIFLF